MQVAQQSSPTRTSRRQLPDRLQAPIRPERAQSPFERGARRSCFFVFACGSVGGGPSTASYAIPGSRVETIPSRRRAVGYAGPVLDQARFRTTHWDVVLKLGLRSRIRGMDLVASVGPLLALAWLPRTGTSVRPRHLEAGGHQRCSAFSMPTHGARTAC